MDVQDEEFLVELHRNLAENAFGPGDPRYVALEEHRHASGPDVIQELGRAIAWTNPGSVFFLTGARGSGKTTQLLRLKGQLTAKGFAVVRIDTEDYLNLRSPLEPIEMLYAMAGAISDAVAEAGYLPAERAMALGWQKLGSWLSRVLSRIDLTPEAQLGAGVDVPGIVQANVSLKAQLRQDESFVAAMNRYLAGRLSELADQANAVVGGVVDELRRGWPERGAGEWQGLVVLFDSLDNVRGVDFEVVRRHLHLLFDLHSATLKLRDIRSVFVVPEWMNVDFELVRRITNVKVTDPEAAGRVDSSDGLKALLEVVQRRVPNGQMDRLFADDRTRDAFLADSGGHLRDLLRLVREAAIVSNSLPLTDQDLDRARQNVRNTLVPIADDERECLRHVRDTHALPLPSQEAWGPLAGLFDRHLVLGYKNGEVWYDVHPLIRDDLDGHA